MIALPVRLPEPVIGPRLFAQTGTLAVWSYLFVPIDLPSHIGAGADVLSRTIDVLNRIAILALKE